MSIFQMYICSLADLKILIIHSDGFTKPVERAPLFARLKDISLKGGKSVKSGNWKRLLRALFFCLQWATCILNIIFNIFNSPLEKYNN